MLGAAVVPDRHAVWLPAPANLIFRDIGLADQVLHQVGASVIGDQTALIELDRELHAAIAEAAGNTLLAAQLDWLYSHVLRLWSVTLDRIDALRASVAEHEAVVDAIVRGDPAQAHDRMQAHVRRFQAAFLESDNARERSD